MARLLAVLVGTLALALHDARRKLKQSSFLQTRPAARGASSSVRPGGRGDNLAKPGTATLRGRVVAADSGQPLRKRRSAPWPMWPLATLSSPKTGW